MDLSPDLLEIAPNLHRLRIPGGGAHLLNSYLWVGPAGVTLFDTGWADSAPVIEAALLTLGRSRDDVDRIVLSHFHEDHAGAAAEIATWSGAIVLAGAADAASVRGEVDGPLPHYTDGERAIHPEPTVAPRAAACRVDVELTDGDVIDFAGGAHVLHVPGHTPGSIALHLPTVDLLLTGDTIAEFHGDVILGVFNTDRSLVRQAAAKLAATGAGRAGFGHGEAVLSDAAARIGQASDPFAAGEV
jgi:glyoxylase-like metal-dependent hydrolase (beta-lactamase superfamily II)